MTIFDALKLRRDTDAFATWRCQVCGMEDCTSTHDSVTTTAAEAPAEWSPRRGSTYFGCEHRFEYRRDMTERQNERVRNERCNACMQRAYDATQRERSGQLKGTNQP